MNVSNFGKLASWSVDGQVFAQPLYVSGVNINGVLRNVVYVATMHNSVYAFDADNIGTAPLWKANFGATVPPARAYGCPAQNFIGPELGVLSTPVIDPTTNTLYVVSATSSGSAYTHYLHALDLSTNQEKFGGPVQIQASVAGTGYDAQNGRVTLTPSADIQRPSLLLANGTVYVAFGDCGPDQDPWHGWVVGYSAANLQTQSIVFNTTPNGGQGGIWQSGRGLVSDATGNIYFNTGNATINNSSDQGVTTGNAATDASKDNYAMRFMQLTAKGQFLASYPPANYASLNKYDLDFSSSGPLMIPGTNLLVTGGKDGIIYLFNSNNLSAPLQNFQATGTAACTYSSDGCQQIRDLAFWNNTLYVWGMNDILRAYAFNPANNTFTTTPSSKNTTYPISGYFPASLAVSGDVNTGGILWAITPNSGTTVPPILHAFDATNVATELWSSNQNSSRDGLPSFPKFTEATVANGRVYVATHSNEVSVYGLLSDFSLSDSPASVSVNQGSSATSSIAIDSLGSSSGPITLSVSSGLPTGATVAFNPPSLASTGSSTLTITTTSATPARTYNLLVKGVRGSATRTASLTLTVITPDVTPPAWSCCTYTSSGSSTVMTFSAWDTQSGLKSIVPVQVVGATTSIPPFTPGTNAVVNFTATESGWSSYVKFQLTDEAGNISYIDPVFVEAGRSVGVPAPYAVKDITPAEGMITIQNGTPGLKVVLIQVDNGLHLGKLSIAGLTDGEIRIVDLRSLLPAAGATVTITPVGKPNGSGMFIFANGPMTGSVP